ncbi:MAG: elongation factor P maturation arginine rhamnosyltransferase EarP [Schlesneria sp.]
MQNHNFTWDIFCKVVDNYGDIGVCWRLARQLADEYDADIRLWVDNLNTFAQLSPSIVTDADVQHLDGMEIHRWRADFPSLDAADVVIEAFACELPESYIEAMAERKTAPVWINLEYLSAEAWVDDSHLLASPHRNLPLKKHFFFPGFTPATGGLIRERDLLSVRSNFNESDADIFLGGLGTPPRDGAEIRVSLFCYDNPVLPELLQEWADGPDRIRVFVTPGAPARQVSDWLGEKLVPGTELCMNQLTLHAIPFLSQSGYDRLLWACDMNFVRGEDSFVRAQWAQRPFVWQIYPQAENAHLVKLKAFLTQYLQNFPDSETVKRFWYGWNGTGNLRASWRDFVAIWPSLELHTKVWVGQLDRTRNLADNLVRFVRGE